MNILNGLKLTPFEWTMSNEFSGSLMEFVIRVCCTGPVDVELFSQAVGTALKQQPLLQANATIGPTHSASAWRPASNLVPVINWISSEPTTGRGDTEEFQTIDLENEIGFRFYGWQYRDELQPRTEMRFVFHHACCDGKGAIAFIEDVLCQYQFVTDGKPGATPTFDCKRIEARDQHGPHLFGLVDRIWRTLIVRPQRAAKMLLTRPRAFGAVPETGELADDLPCQCSTTLDQQTTEQLGFYAKSLGATTNLVLARALFHVLGDHLELSEDREAGSRNRSPMRLLIPFSLRTETHRAMPAANCVSMAYLESKQELIDRDSIDNPVLLAELARQLAFIRKWKLEYSWIESVRSMARLRPLINLLKRSQKKKSKGQVATTVLSNLGRVFSSELLPTYDGKIKIGSLEIESVHLVLPCTSKLSINFSVNFYRNCLTLDVSYLPSAFTKARVENMLESWKSRILEVVEVVEWSK